MTKWELPPKEGHMDKPSGIYLQTMSIAEINERVKKKYFLATLKILTYESFSNINYLK